MIKYIKKIVYSHKIYVNGGIRMAYPGTQLLIIRFV